MKPRNLMQKAGLVALMSWGVALSVVPGVALAETGSFEISNAEALSYADQLDPGFVSMVGDCLAISNHDPEATLACAYEWMQVQNSQAAAPQYAETADQMTRSAAFLLVSAIPNAQVIGGGGFDCTEYTPDIPLVQSCLSGTAIVAFTDATGTAADSLAAGICYAYHDLPVVVTSVICQAQNGVPVAGGGVVFATTPPFVVSRPNVLDFEAAGVHPGGVSGGSTSVKFQLFIPGCSNCSGPSVPSEPPKPEPPPSTGPVPPVPIDDPA
jgi:hypothetical protein